MAWWTIMIEQYNTQFSQSGQKLSPSKLSWLKHIPACRFVFYTQHQKYGLYQTLTNIFTQMREKISKLYTGVTICRGSEIHTLVLKVLRLKHWPPLPLLPSQHYILNPISLPLNQTLNNLWGLSKLNTYDLSLVYLNFDVMEFIGAEDVKGNLIFKES